MLLRAFNMHPFKAQVQHIDFQRVSKDKKIHMKVPLHFVNAEKSPGVKEQGGVVSHVLNELDITCLPDDLPEFIEVDMGHLTVGNSIHVKDLVLPKGVEPVLHKGENPVVATVILPALITEERKRRPRRLAAADVPTTEQAAPEKAAEAAAGGDKAAAKPGDKAAADKGDKPARKSGREEREEVSLGRRIRLVVGLGNPGKEYERTRHNAGFWLVERFAAHRRRRCARTASTRRWSAAGTNGAWLVMPQTFMNASGRAVQMLAGFFKIPPEEILVVHDELDFPPGTARIKQGGGIAGHNGLRDISQRLGSHDYWRLRLGIGQPGDQDVVADYVLGRPSAEDARRSTAPIARGSRCCRSASRATCRARCRSCTALLKRKSPR